MGMLGAGVAAGSGVGVGRGAGVGVGVDCGAGAAWAAAGAGVALGRYTYRAARAGAGVGDVGCWQAATERARAKARKALGSLDGLVCWLIRADLVITREALDPRIFHLFVGYKSRFGKCFL